MKKVTHNNATAHNMTCIHLMSSLLFPGLNVAVRKRSSWLSISQRNQPASNCRTSEERSMGVGEVIVVHVLKL